MTDAFAPLNTALAGRYRVDRELGQGGMATVYLAEDLKHGRRVAVKVLLPELAAAVGHDRFLREITTTANLRHPHILPLYDSGEAGGMLYFVMPFVDGESLVYWLRKLIFRGAWLDHRVKEGKLEVGFDEDTAEFSYQDPNGGRALLELLPTPSWHEVQYRR